MPARKKWLWRDKDGELKWHDHPAPEFGKPEGEKNTTRHFGANGWATGLESDAAGVHSSQVDEFREDARSHGFTGVEFSNDGQVRFHSRGQRAAYLRHRGLFDRDAGYGDANPRHG